MALKDTETKPLRGPLLREAETDELRRELARLEEARFRLRFRAATEALDSPIQHRIIRRNIARIKTILRQRSGK
jgi:large subunit ribosomal protein L29